MTIDEIGKALLGLSTPELEQIRMRCVALQQMSSTRPRALSPTSNIEERKAISDADIVLDELVEFMKDRGADFASPTMLRRVNGFKAFEAKVPTVMQCINKITKTKVEKHYLLGLAFDLLYKDMRRMGVATSTRTMMAQFHRIPAVLAAAFPGYYETGFMHLVLKQAMQTQARS